MKTNREHYSWSQHSLFLSSKRSFYKRYVLGEDQPDNIRFDKGRELGRYLETDDLPPWMDDPMLKVVGTAIKKLEVMEMEIKVNIFPEDERPEWSKPILMYLDSAMEDCSLFYEYKTGKEPWTQKRVNEHNQLCFYALGLYLKSGQKIIPECSLFWAETKDEILPDGNVRVLFTGHVEEFKRKFTLDELSATILEVARTQQEIYEFEFEEIELDEDLVSRYAELSEQKKEIEKELSKLKLVVEAEMIEYGVQYGKSKAGTFSYSKRSKWLYSNELEDKEAQYAAEIAKLKNKERMDGTAVDNPTKFIVFRKNK